MWVRAIPQTEDPPRESGVNADDVLEREAEVRPLGPGAGHIQPWRVEDKQATTPQGYQVAPLDLTKPETAGDRGSHSRVVNSPELLIGRNASSITALSAGTDTNPKLDSSVAFGV